MMKTFNELIRALDKHGAISDQVIVVDRNVFESIKTSIRDTEMNDEAIEYQFPVNSSPDMYSVGAMGYNIHFTTNERWYERLRPVLNKKPVLDRILIKQDDGRSEIEGFEVPESEKEKPHMGTVVAVGPGGRDHEGRLIPMTAKVGDKVMYSEFATTLLEIEGQDYILIKEGDLHLIL